MIKKILCISLSAALCGIFLVGCGNSDKKANNDSVEVTSSLESGMPTIVKNPNFRNALWGMSKDEVKASEDSTPTEENETGLLYSSVTVSNMSASVMYSFDEDEKLYQGFYLFTDSHTSYNLYIDDYKKLVGALTEKYGEPEWDRTKWKDDLYKGDENDYGTAVATGGLIYGAQWKSDDTEIDVVLKGDNFDVELTCTYIDINNNKELDNTEGL